jgi:hypothetical protein
MAVAGSMASEAAEAVATAVIMPKSPVIRAEIGINRIEVAAPEGQGLHCCGMASWYPRLVIDRVHWFKKKR